MGIWRNAGRDGEGARGAGRNRLSGTERQRETERRDSERHREAREDAGRRRRTEGARGGEMERQRLRGQGGGREAGEEKRGGTRRDAVDATDRDCAWLLGIFPSLPLPPRVSPPHYPPLSLKVSLPHAVSFYPSLPLPVFICSSFFLPVVLCVLPSLNFRVSTFLHFYISRFLHQYRNVEM